MSLYQMTELDRINLINQYSLLKQNASDEQEKKYYAQQIDYLILGNIYLFENNFHLNNEIKKKLQIKNKKLQPMLTQEGQYFLKELLDLYSYFDLPILEFSSDHLGTPRKITNKDNILQWSWNNIEPFGDNEPVSNSNIEFNFRFPGQYYDKETKTNYNLFRDYNFSLGRYVQSDPIGLSGGLNSYVYIDQNPLSYFDINGLKKFDWDGQGDISVCTYYDPLIEQYPNCEYYQSAVKICRGKDGLVNGITEAGMYVSWKLTDLEDSQSVILNNIRNILILEDKATRSQGLIDKNFCPCGNDVDRYHRFAFNFAGISTFYYGGHWLPQNFWLNPVPKDFRNNTLPWSR